MRKRGYPRRPVASLASVMAPPAAAAKRSAAALSASKIGIYGSRFLGLCLAAAVPLLLPSSASADPRAATISQVDWNSETRRLEVALKADPEALERALEAYFGLEIKLANNAEDVKLARRLERYVSDTFVVEPAANAKPAPLSWVGWELESHRAAWLYFEIPLAEGFDGALLSNRLFFEVEPRQLHVLRFRYAGTQIAFTLSREKPTHTLRRSASSEAEPPS